jgi:hypothetical protein
VTGPNGCHSRFRTVGQDYDIEAPTLRPLPSEAFEPGLRLTQRVDSHGRITVRQCFYSVPARLIGRRVRVLRASELLCIDELGYRELDRRGAELLFQGLTEREETNLIAIASNQPFSGWTRTFTDPRLCAAIIDRLTFAGNIRETGTHSYRLAHARSTRAS